MSIVATYSLRPYATGRDGTDDGTYVAALTGNTLTFKDDNLGTAGYWSSDGTVPHAGVANVNTMSPSQNAYMDFDDGTDQSAAGSTGDPLRVRVLVRGSTQEISSGINGFGPQATATVQIVLGSVVVDIPPFLFGSPTSYYEGLIDMTGWTSAERSAVTAAWQALDVQGTIRCDIASGYVAKVYEVQLELGYDDAIAEGWPLHIVSADDVDYRIGPRWNPDGGMFHVVDPISGRQWVQGYDEDSATEPFPVSSWTFTGNAIDGTWADDGATSLDTNGDGLVVSWTVLSPPDYSTDPSYVDIIFPPCTSSATDPTAVAVTFSAAGSLPASLTTEWHLMDGTTLDSVSGAPTFTFATTDAGEMADVIANGSYIRLYSKDTTYVSGDFALDSAVQLVDWATALVGRPMRFYLDDGVTLFATIGMVLLDIAPPGTGSFPDGVDDSAHVTVTGAGTADEAVGSDDGDTSYVTFVIDDIDFFTPYVWFAFPVEAGVTEATFDPLTVRVRTKNISGTNMDAVGSVRGFGTGYASVQGDIDIEVTDYSEQVITCALSTGTAADALAAYNDGSFYVQVQMSGDPAEMRLSTLSIDLLT